MDCFQPDERFIQFLQYDFQFVDEVIPTLGGTALTIIRRGRCAGSKDLATDVSTGRCTGKHIHQLDHSHSKVDQPILNHIRPMFS